MAEALVHERKLHENESHETELSGKRLQLEVVRLRQENDELKARLVNQQTLHTWEQLESDKFASRLRHLMELMPAGVVLIDNTGLVSLCNPAAEQFLGLPLLQQPWANVIARSFDPQSDDGYEISLRDGRRVQLHTCALTAEPGQLLMLTDLTETRLLQSRLSHYQRLSEMGRMMASLAHQIRTPLSAALLYLDHLNRPEQLTREQRIRFAAKARSRLQHLEQQVRDMLLFARGESRLEDRLTTDELLCELEDQLDVPLAHHEGDCELINNAPGAVIQCNRDTLLGALMNLVNNALQAGGVSVDLTIRLDESEGGLQLCVGDNGPGMDTLTCQRAQEPFYTTKSHGTGLGLAVAQVVAHAHHGTFNLHSEQGVGTLVSLTLPVFEMEARQL